VPGHARGNFFLYHPEGPFLYSLTIMRVLLYKSKRHGTAHSPYCTMPPERVDLPLPRDFAPWSSAQPLLLVFHITYLWSGDCYWSLFLTFQPVWPSGWLFCLVPFRLAFPPKRFDRPLLLELSLYVSAFISPFCLAYPFGLSIWPLCSTFPTDLSVWPFPFPFVLSICQLRLTFHWAISLTFPPFFLNSLSRCLFHHSVCLSAWSFRLAFPPGLSFWSYQATMPVLFTEESYLATMPVLFTKESYLATTM
jgi:hypothetical protein